MLNVNFLSICRYNKHDGKCYKVSNNNWRSRNKWEAVRWEGHYVEIESFSAAYRTQRPFLRVRSSRNWCDIILRLGSAIFMGTRNGLIAFSLKRLCCSDLIQLRRRLFSHYLLENSSSRTVFLSEVTPPSLFIHPHLSVCIHISFCQSPLINY